MNEDIMLIANTMVYNHQLRCGTRDVAIASLRLNNISLLPPLRSDFSSSPNWLLNVVRPETRVLFLNTDLLPNLESKEGGTVNRTESSLIRLIAFSLVKCGVKASEIGIISPYRAQCRLVSDCVREHEDLEVSTVDRFQGRDKEVIFISFCCANETKQVGSLLKDWRRVNVAFTRAKKKLLMLGSLSTLTSDSLFQSLFDLLSSKGWVYSLPLNSLEMYETDSLFPNAAIKKEKNASEKKIYSFAPTLRTLSQNLLAEMNGSNK
jgi:DNA replication ATP-dependent helicase Dna2